MSDKLVAIKKLLRKHDYLVVVQQTGDGCVVTFPHPILLLQDKSLPRVVECFAIRREKEPGMWVNTSFDQPDDPGKFIVVPEYAMRLFIVCEINAWCHRLSVDPSLVVYLTKDNQEKENIHDVIDNPDDMHREGFLQGLVIEAIKDNFTPMYEDVAKTEGVSEGYQLIRPFFD